ncbi:hypothetical protein PHYSODRAFT_502549, partial [Phytophthora sojae]
SSPLRNVTWVFLGSAREYAGTLYFFLYTCGDRFMEAARSSQALALPPSDVERLRGGPAREEHRNSTRSNSSTASGIAGTPQPNASSDGTASPGDRAVPGEQAENARRGRRDQVGEICHGSPPVDGLTLLLESLNTMRALDRQNATTRESPHAFRV